MGDSGESEDLGAEISPVLGPDQEPARRQGRARRPGECTLVPPPPPPHVPEVVPEAVAVDEAKAEANKGRRRRRGKNKNQDEGAINSPDLKQEGLADPAS